MAGRVSGARTAIVLLTLAAVVACADLKDIFALQRGLSREFPAQGINVHLNNRTHLTVTFSAGRLPEGELAPFARRVGEYVRDNYPGYRRLETIRVGFESEQQDEFHFQFTPADLGPPRKELKQGLPVKAALATYPPPG